MNIDNFILMNPFEYEVDDKNSILLSLMKKYLIFITIKIYF